MIFNLGRQVYLEKQLTTEIRESEIMALFEKENEEYSFLIGNHIRWANFFIIPFGAWSRQ